MTHILINEKRHNNAWMYALGILMLAVLCCVSISRFETSDGRSYAIWEKQEALEHQQEIACAVSKFDPATGEWKCKILKREITPGIPVDILEPQHTFEEKLIVNHNFGKDDPKAKTPLEAAQNLLQEYGEQNAKVYCEELIWDTTLNTLITELSKETVFGVPKSNFCTQGGRIEIQPPQ